MTRAKAPRRFVFLLLIPDVRTNDPLLAAHAMASFIWS
jgi:hypothetical protein